MNKIKKRELSPLERRVRELADKEGITKAAAAGKLRSQESRVKSPEQQQKQTNPQSTIPNQQS